MKKLKFLAFFICLTLSFNTVVFADELDAPSNDVEPSLSVENENVKEIDDNSEESDVNNENSSGEILEKEENNEFNEEISDEVPSETPSETPTEIPTETQIEIPTEPPIEPPVETPIDVPSDDVIKNEEENLLLNVELLGKHYDTILPYIDELQKKGVIVTTEYDYSDFYEEDYIMEVSCEDLSTLKEGDELLITVSLGKNDSAMLLTSNLSMTKSNMVQSNGDAANKGYMVDWDRIPASYEYNWDNSENCWTWGVWIDGQCYKTTRGEYSTDVRHKMQIYTDGTYVYLHIIFSRDYQVGFNGSDYRFTVNGNATRVQIECPNNGEGEYSGTVTHGDGAISGQIVEGSECHVFYNANNQNNQLELKVPLEELARQNPNISYGSSNTISYFSPNLMYESISCVGASTFPYIPVLIIFGIAIITFFSRKRILKDV